MIHSVHISLRLSSFRSIYCLSFSFFSRFFTFDVYDVCECECAFTLLVFAKLFFVGSMNSSDTKIFAARVMNAMLLFLYSDG